MAGERAEAARLYASAAEAAESTAERTHLFKQAARLRDAPALHDSAVPSAGRLPPAG